MVYEGYLRFGETDVVNDARTHQYAGGVLKCPGCDSLAVAAGAVSSGYTTPVADQAPWTVGNNAGACFSGLIITKTTGFYDAARRLTVSEKIGTGGVPTAGRYGSRVLGITARALASSEAGMNAGLEWLTNVLTGTHPCETGDCAGSSLHLFDTCPEICDNVPDTNAVPVVTPAVSDPASWTATAGTLGGDYTELASWFADVAARDSQKVNVIMLGDSTVEGYRLDSMAETLPQQLNTVLREEFPTSADGGFGFITAQSDTVNLPFWPQALAGGATVLNPFGTTGRYVDLSTAGKTVTYTVQDGGISSFDIHVIKGAYGSATGGYYKIDGGAAVPFATNDAAPVLASILHVASPVTSTIEIGYNAGGGALISGVVEYRGDDTTGITVHNLGYSGSQVADWLAITGTGGPLDWVLLMAPSVFIIQLGINDARTGDGNLTAAQYKTDLTNYIAAIRSKGGVLATVPIVLSMTYDPSTGPGGAGLNQPWPNYVQAAREIAEADATVVMVDHSAWMYANYLPDTDGLYNAAYPPHASAHGYEVMAQTLARTLIPEETTWVGTDGVITYDECVNALCGPVVLTWTVLSEHEITVTPGAVGGVDTLTGVPTVVPANTATEVVFGVNPTPGFPDDDCWNPTITVDGTTEGEVRFSLTITAQPVMTDEQQVSRVRRRFDGVVVVDGPKEIDRVTVRGNVFSTVEWTMVATDPWLYRDPEPIWEGTTGSVPVFLAAGVELLADNSAFAEISCPAPSSSLTTCADNPACPPLLSPPAAPTVPGCDPDVATWNRQWVEIPAQVVGQGDAVLTASYTNPTGFAQTIRIRLYTADSFTTECAFTQELWVDYVPPGATVMVSEGGQVLVTCDDGSVVNATRNVRGNYRGPYTPLVLGCSVDWVAAFDVAGTDTTNLWDVSLVNRTG